MDGPRVLVVEDRPSVLRLMATDPGGLLRRHHAPDGAAALRSSTRGPFDVVLTDVRMPDASGFDVLRAVQRRAPPRRRDDDRVRERAGRGRSHEARRVRLRGEAPRRGRDLARRRPRGRAPAAERAGRPGRAPRATAERGTSPGSAWASTTPWRRRATAPRATTSSSSCACSTGTSRRPRSGPG